MKFILPAVIFIISQFSLANSIRLAPPQSAFDASHDYYVGLLTLALTLTEPEFGAFDIQINEHILEQGRALRELAANRSINVYFAGSNILREKELNAIRIPLTKGILGYRGLVIRKDKQALFDSITTPDQLQNLIACQGMHWPDSDILERNNYKVQRLAVYEQMFLMVNAGHCDYFPRAMHEGQVEIDARAQEYPELIFYKNIILRYPFAMYFFTAKDNSQLATRIEKGLMIAIETGLFDEYMRDHSTTAHLFPFDDWLGNCTFELINTDLLRDTPIWDEKLWLQPYKMSHATSETIAAK